MWFVKRSILHGSVTYGSSVTWLDKSFNRKIDKVINHSIRTSFSVAQSGLIANIRGISVYSFHEA